MNENKACWELCEKQQRESHSSSGQRLGFPISDFPSPNSENSCTVIHSRQLDTEACLFVWVCPLDLDLERFLWKTTIPSVDTSRRGYIEA